jgi:hypothetical protein
MQYRITYTTAEGATRVVTSDPHDALNFAFQLLEQGREDVWISDADGNLMTPREFEKFLAQGR